VPDGRHAEKVDISMNKKETLSIEESMSIHLLEPDQTDGQYEEYFDSEKNLEWKPDLDPLKLKDHSAKEKISTKKLIGRSSFWKIIIRRKKF
jgi:hypothetical protein